MPAPNILKSFLISIGYKIDDQSKKKYETAWEKLGKMFVDTSIKAVGAAIEISTAVVKITDSLNKLYFASQRTGASAENLLAFEQVADKIGLSKDEIDSAIEGIASALRDDPGLNQLLRDFFHIDPDSDPTEIILKLVNILRRMPFNQARPIAAQFGINEKTLFMMEKNYDVMVKTFEARKKLAQASGINVTDLVKASHEFQNLLSEIYAKFQILEFLFAKRFLPIVRQLFEWISEGTDKLIAWDKATDGASTKFIALAAAITGVGTALAGIRVAGSLARLLLGVSSGAGAAAGGAGAAAGGAGAAAAGTGGLFAAVGAAGAAVATGAGLVALAAAATYGALKGAEWIAEHTEWGKKLKGEVKGWMDEFGNGGLGKKLGLYFEFDKSGIAARDKEAQNATPLHNPGNLRSWGNAPLVEKFRNGESVGKFAQFDSDLEGLSALAGQLIRYAQHGKDTIKSIVDTYAPPGDKNDTPGYEKKVANETGFGLNEKLNLLDPAVLSKLMLAIEHAEQSGKIPDASLTTEAANYRLQKEGLASDKGGTTTFTQTTTIKIEGSESPGKTAKDVAGQQSRVNGDAIRQLKGAVR